LFRSKSAIKRSRRPAVGIDSLEPRRLFAVGALDTTFNGTGKRAVDFGGVGLDELYDVAVQGDGKIVAVGSKGSTNTYSNGGDFAVVRLLDNGTPDPAFGTNGVRTFDFGGEVERANAVAIQPDGKIVIGGSTHAPGAFWGDWVVLRLNATDGSLDSTFGGGTGRVVTSLGSQDQLYDLAIQQDGKVVAAGQATVTDTGLGIVRYNADGSLDTSFDGDGKLTMGASAGAPEANAVLVQPDGKIVITDPASSGGVSALGIRRFNANGSPDTSFGGGTGFIADNIGGGTTTFPSAIALAPDGGYFVTAAVGSSSRTQQLRKYTSTGARATFGTSGGVTLGTGGLYGVNVGLLVQANGYVVVAATTSSATSSFYGTTTIARVTPAGAFDTSFNGTGKLVLSEGGNAANAAFDNQGRVVVVAAGGVSINYDGEVVRVSTEGVSAVTGRLMTDADGDGVVEAGDTPIAGFTIYIDLDNDGVLDTGERRAVSDASGVYRFDGLHVTNPPGGYPFKLALPAGYGSRLAGAQLVLGAPGGTFNASDWPIFAGQSVSGKVFNDANANGVFDAGETGLSAFDVYLDANANGRFDAGEKTVTTDGQGAYSLVIGATSTLRLKWPINYRQTYPATDGGQTIGYSAGTSFVGVNFGAIASAFTATATYDANGRQTIFQWDRRVALNSVQFTLTNLGTGQVYTAYNTLGFIGDQTRFAFQTVGAGDSTTPALPDGNYRAKLTAGSVKDYAGNLQPADLTLDFSFLRGDFNGDKTVNDTDYATLAGNFGLASGAKYAQGDYNYSGAIDATDRTAFFAQFGKTQVASPGTINGSVFNDADADGVNDAGESGISSRTVYLDVNGNGALDTNEPTRTTTGLGGGYSFLSVGPGNYAVRTVVPSGSRQTLPASNAARTIALAVGQVSNANDFGVTTLPAWVGPGSVATWNATSKTLTVTGAVSIVADPGADNPVITANGIAAAVTINPASGGVVRLAQLSLFNGATATMTAGGGERTLVVGTISISGASKLNLTDHALVVRNGGEAAVQPLLASAYGTGGWDGANGITSSTAAADPSGITGLGYVTNAGLNKTSFGGVTGLTPSDVLVKYTYYGDCDLSGSVNLDDFTLFLGGYQGSANTWFKGNFNYNGLATLDDFGLFLAGYQRQGGAL
jgi:uncharacterized delta-60 repeat protein